MKIVVYTVMTDDYDVIAPTTKEDGVEYLALVDKDSNRTIPAPWKRVDFGLTWKRLILGFQEARRRSRIPKIAPHAFIEADISIYVDASLLIINPIVDFAKSMIETNDIAVIVHPSTACLYEEASKVIRLRLDDSAAVKAHVERYRREGFPARFGLTENSFIVRRHSDRMSAFNDLWLTEYLNGSQRDQLSFMYCVWRKQDIKLNIVMQNARQNQYYVQREHLKSRVVA
jgi:hypothetical protein